MQIVFAIILFVMTLAFAAVAVVCIMASYRTVWHIVGILQRKEKLHLDFHLFTVVCAVFILAIIVAVWPIAMYHFWVSRYS